MRSAQVTLGRQFVLAFDHGDDFFDALRPRSLARASGLVTDCTGCDPDG